MLDGLLVYLPSRFIFIKYNFFSSNLGRLIKSTTSTNKIEINPTHSWFLYGIRCLWLISCLLLLAAACTEHTSRSFSTTTSMITMTTTEKKILLLSFWSSLHMFRIEITYLHIHAQVWTMDIWDYTWDINPSIESDK